MFDYVSDQLAKGCGMGEVIPRVILRLARPDDLPRIADLSRDVLEFGRPRRWSARRLAVQLGQSDTCCVVAQRATTVAGFVLFGLGERNAFVSLLAVAPLFQGRGIGRSLLRWAETSAATAGMSLMALEVRAENAAAIMFYRRLGYVARGIVPNYYGAACPALKMIRVLNATAVSDDLY